MVSTPSAKLMSIESPPDARHIGTIRVSSSLFLQDVDVRLVHGRICECRSDASLFLLDFGLQFRVVIGLSSSFARVANRLDK